MSVSELHAQSFKLFSDKLLGKDSISPRCVQMILSFLFSQSLTL